MEKLAGLRELINDEKPFNYAPEKPFSINFLHFSDIFS